MHASCSRPIKMTGFCLTCWIARPMRTGTLDVDSVTFQLGSRGAGWDSRVIGSNYEEDEGANGGHIEILYCRIHQPATIGE